MGKVTINEFKLKPGTDRTIYAHWTCSDVSKTKQYSYLWEYAVSQGDYTLDNVAFIRTNSYWSSIYEGGNLVWLTGSSGTTAGGSDSQVEVNDCEYEFPENALQIRFTIKAIAADNPSTSKPYWTDQWTAYKTYYSDQTRPTAPTIDTFEFVIKDGKYTDTMEIALSDINKYTTNVSLIVYKDDKQKDSVKYSIDSASISSKHAIIRYTFSERGTNYRLVVQAYNKNGICSEPSEATDAFDTLPVRPFQITEAYPYTSLTTTSSSGTLYISWRNVLTASAIKNENGAIMAYSGEQIQNGLENVDDTKIKYDIEYTNDINLVHTNLAEIQSDIDCSLTGRQYYLNGLTLGSTYYLSLRTSNDKGKSEWSDVYTVVVGKKPGIPTTYASSNNVKVGDELYLYWIHNSTDNSAVVESFVEITDESGKSYSVLVKNPYYNDEEKRYNTQKYSLNTSQFTSGAKLTWRVYTKGIYEEHSDWSITRTINIYASPTLNLTTNWISYIQQYPVEISCNTILNTEVHTPVAYELNVIYSGDQSNYEVMSLYGDKRTVKVGDVVYREVKNTNLLNTTFTIDNNIKLPFEQGKKYSFSVIVTTTTGISVTKTVNAMVQYKDYTTLPEPNASIFFSPTAFSASISPYCNTSRSVKLSIFRINHDYTITEIATNIPNGNLQNGTATSIIDPHPSLNGVYYRIIAVDSLTGQSSYSDLPAEFIDCQALLIQWDEVWQNAIYNENALAVGLIDENPPWSGSILKLPYNLDIQYSNDKQVTLINYAGRKNVVSYYGEAINQKVTANVDIPYNDYETLYQLKRLQEWQGDVYIREPNGDGYWASITVQISIVHCELTIPVSIDITRTDENL